MQDLVLALDRPGVLALVAGVAFVAGYVRGYSGFGGPAIMLLVLTQFYTPASVIAKVLVMDMVAGIQLARDALREVQWRQTLALSVATAATIPFGLSALYGVDPELASRLVALLVLVCTAAMMAGLRLARTPRAWWWALFGALAGAVIGLTGMAMLGMVFIFSMPERAATSRANAVVWLLIITPVALAAHGYGGTLGLDELWRAALAGLVYLLGAVIGARRFRAADESRFRRLVTWLLLALATVGLVT